MGQWVFQGLIFNDTELLIKLIRTRSGLFRLNLSLNRVVRLLPRSITPHRRDHIIYVVSRRELSVVSTKMDTAQVVDSLKH